MNLSDRVLFIDGEAIVIDKPAGLPVDPPRAGGASVTGLLEQLQFGFRRRPVVLHRLDRDTSGCLLLARQPKAAKRFQQAFEQRRVEKIYLAVIAGLVAEDGGLIDCPLKKVSTPAEGWRVVGHHYGTAAQTRWRRLAESGGRTLVELRPLTGRTHQLRVHAREGLGAAIVGDPLYGGGPGPMLLHALRLVVPREPKPAVDATAPVPDHFGEWRDAA